MKRTSILLVALLALTGCGGETATPEEEAFEALPRELAEKAAALQERALADAGAYEFLRDLTTEVGPRFAGSPGDRQGVAWAAERLRELGFMNVRTEEVEVPQWVRGRESGAVTAPYPQPMVLTALGGSVGTPPGGLEAEVVEVPDVDDLAGLRRDQVEGRIVFLSRAMESTRDGAGYGKAVQKRVNGAARAAELGAVAVLIRSAGTSVDRFAHTGTMRYADDVPRIPAAALANSDAAALSRMIALARNANPGEPVRFRLELGAHYRDPQTSANVIGEIVGREHPEEIVLLAAHLDSWDLGTGAVDDGAGCAIITAAARLIGETGAPRRTVRVLLAANEEFGLSGGTDYAVRYENDMVNHTAAMESDLGAEPVWAFRSRVEEEKMPVVRDLARLLAPLGIENQGNEAHGGADLRGLRPHQVPLFDLPQDAREYFKIHHTGNDVFEKVDPEELAQNVAAYATVAFVLAELEEDLGRAPEMPHD